MWCLLLVGIGLILWKDISFNHDARQRAFKSVTHAQIDAFGDALEMYKRDIGYYPKGANGLMDLVIQPAGVTNWHQILDKVPLDYWGHPYLYECPGQHRTNSYDLSSAGPDGKFGTEDDIRNWDMPTK